LFESLLQNFEAHLAQAQRVRSSRPPGTQQAHVAVSGFLLFQPSEAWGEEQYDIITRYLEGDLSLDALEWYEDSVQAVQMFACLALGALIGMKEAGMIDEAGFLFGNAHLGRFLSLENETIHERYSTFRAS
jgi:hypothetical protein